MTARGGDPARIAIDDYRSFGGRCPDSAAVANVLRHGGVVNPLTKKPFTEAAVLGIAGGISGGYSFCPSVFRYGMGSGVAIVGRHLAYTFDGSFHRAALDRLGIKPKTTESATPGGGLKNLRAELREGRPVIVWCTQNLGYLDCDPAAGVTSCTGWSLVVHGLDEERQEASVADLARESVRVPITTLTTARSAVCSHKNRTMRFDPPRAIAASVVEKAYREGIASCVAAQRKPRIKTFSLSGLEAAAKAIANVTGRQGWLKTFGKRMFWPLKDVFVSIECRGGGRLMRPIYAEFLDEAAAATGNRELSACAAEYRRLGEAWRSFAEAALPSAIDEFRRVKELRRRRVDVFHDHGAAGLARHRKSWEQLADLEQNLTNRFPLKDSETRKLLGGLSGALAELVAAERAAIDRLAAATA